MYTRTFFPILAVFLATVVPSLSIPIHSPKSQALEANRATVPVSGAASLLVSRDDFGSIAARSRQDEEYLLSRAIYEDLLPRVLSPKAEARKTAALARKDSVREQVSHNQAANAAKKEQLKKETAALPEGHRYGKPRAKKGVVPSGYRAAGRAGGHRLPKQPKTPKPNFAKGEHLTNAKAATSQAAAKVRLEDRKAAGRAKWAGAKETHQKTLKHGNMPHRKDSYPVPNHDVLTGKEVRQGASHLALHDGKGGNYPVTFRNQEQGPADNRHVPLPDMVGTGKEYPIQKGGYHPGEADQGPVRGIYQDNAEGGYNVQGVVSHDVTLDKSHPGYNDHIPVNRVAYVPPTNPSGSGSG